MFSQCELTASVHAKCQTCVCAHVLNSDVIVIFEYVKEFDQEYTTHQQHAAAEPRSHFEHALSVDMIQ